MSLSQKNLQFFLQVAGAVLTYEIVLIQLQNTN